MELSPLVSPSGDPIFTAGGATAWKTAEYRGYVASLEWTRRRRKFMPTLVIWPATNIFTVSATKPGMWAITRDCMTEFVGFDRDGHCTGSASEHCYREAYEALTVLGKDRNDRQAFVALVDVVLRFGPELIRMPVAPKAVKLALMDQAIWDVATTNKSTGKTIDEASI